MTEDRISVFFWGVEGVVMIEQPASGCQLLRDAKLDPIYQQSEETKEICDNVRNLVICLVLLTFLYEREILTHLVRTTQVSVA